MTPRVSFLSAVRALLAKELRIELRTFETLPGMAQRVAACRAVLHDPELLLLDEPTAHLDPSAVALLAPLVGPGATRADGTPRTRVVTSHDPWEAISQADVVLGLRDGRVVLVGQAGDVDPEALGALYA